MDKVRTFANKQAIKFPFCQDIILRYLATHLRNQYRFDALGRREVSHVILTRWNSTGDEERLTVWTLQSGGKPDYMLGRPTDIEASNDANDLHKNFGLRISDCGLRIIVFNPLLLN